MLAMAIALEQRLLKLTIILHRSKQAITLVVVQEVVDIQVAVDILAIQAVQWVILDHVDISAILDQWV